MSAIRDYDFALSDTEFVSRYQDSNDVIIRAACRRLHDSTEEIAQADRDHEAYVSERDDEFMDLERERDSLVDMVHKCRAYIESDEKSFDGDVAMIKTIDACLAGES